VTFAGENGTPEESQGDEKTAAPSQRSSATGEFWEIPLRWTRPEDIVRAIQTDTRPRPEIRSSMVRPETDTERMLARLWMETLRLEEVGIEDQFFDLGGASLHLVRVQGRILTETGVNLDITTLFQHTTIRSLAAELDGLESGSRNLVGVQDRARRQRAALAAARGRADRRAR